MKIAAVGGSLRPHSYTYQILHLALKELESQGARTELVDLRQLQLPFCDGRFDYPDYPDVAALRGVIQTSQALILATPEYHGNISGVLKNALDLLDEEQIKNKVIGLIGVMGGGLSTNAVNTLRLVCRQLHGWVIPEQLLIPYAEENFDVLGQLKDPILEERLKQMMASLIEFAHKLRSNKS